MKTVFLKSNGEFVGRGRVETSPVFSVGNNTFPLQGQDDFIVVDGHWDWYDTVLGRPILTGGLGLPELRKKRIDEVKEKRDQIEQSGSNGFDTDLKAIVRMLAASTGLKKAGANAKVGWTKQDGSKVDLKADDIDNVVLGAVARADAVHERARQLIAQIEAAQDPAAIMRVDIESGWPA